jgi:hypothetical protein
MVETWYSGLGYLFLNSNRVLPEILCQHVKRDSLFFLNCCRLEAISLEVTCMQLCMKILSWNTSCYCPHVQKALSPILLLLATTLWMWVSSSFSVFQFKVWLVVFFSLKWALSKLVLTQISGFLLITIFVGYVGGLVPILTILLRDVRFMHHTMWCSKCPISGIGDSHLQVLMQFSFKCWCPAHHTRCFIVAAEG